MLKKPNLEKFQIGKQYKDRWMKATSSGGYAFDGGDLDG